MVSFLNTLTSLFVYSSRSQGRRFCCQKSSFSFMTCQQSVTLDGDQQRCQDTNDNDTKHWLVLGDGDLSYSASIAEELAKSNTRMVATVLEEESVHNRVYERSTQNTKSIISSSGQHEVKFGIDATRLLDFFPETKFDCIEFNFPHWRGKTNAKYNRELLDSFLGSASTVLKQEGEIRVALCDGQGGMPAESLSQWRQSWMPAMYAAQHGLVLRRMIPYSPKYGLSSHRGVDRPFHLGKLPQKYFFAFPNHQPIDEDLQISCRHELRVMLHPEKLENSSISYDSIVDGDAVFEIGKEFIPKGIRFEIPARNLLTPYELKGGHVPLAVFLLNYSGESMPLTRQAADNIRANIEAAIVEKWRLDIAKGGRLVSRPYPYHLLPTLIKEY